MEKVPRHKKLGATLGVALLLAAVLVATLVFVGAAAALPTFNTADKGIGPCDSCHTKADTHSKAQHVAANVYNLSDPTTCANCHPNGDVNVIPLPSKCGACHNGVANILSKPTHTQQGCGTTAGCHGATGPTTPVTTTLSAKVAPTSVKAGKTVTISGTAGPAAQLAGAKIAILVNRKSGSKWVKAKSANATASTTGTYSWKYKATKKASYQVKVSVSATDKYTAKSVTKTFEAK
jgi:hypothetical protein